MVDNKICFPKPDYLTFNELITRWNCTPPQLHYSIMTGDLKPCYWVDGEVAFCHEEKILDDGGMEYNFIGVTTTGNLFYLHGLLIQGPSKYTFVRIHKDRDIEETSMSGYFVPSKKIPITEKEIEQNAVFLMGEISLFEKNHNIKPWPKPSVDKPLAPRQRNTLLTIINALCEHSNIDIKSRGTAAQIARMTEEMGTPVGQQTILDLLKEIPDAVETRMK